MSAVEGGPAGGGISATNVAILGIVGGLAGIYLASILNDITTTTYFSFFGGIGAILAGVWGADAVRRVCSYGLGTGVPSIGMVALGMGIVAAIFGLALCYVINIPVVLGPIIAFIVAAIIGLIMGTMANKILNMNIPIMERCMVEIAGAGCLVMIALCVTISGTLIFTSDIGTDVTILSSVVQTGFIALIFIGGAMIILHPFNACLGPDESQDRTLYVGVEKGGIIMALSGVASLMVIGVIPAALTILIGLLIWIVYFTKFINLTKRDAHKVIGTGLLPTEEELQ
ncbi:MAG: tetrahydromethanopterin S-methyltransferase subunit C [ANME-2 cluster archaeon]|nr:tetrahydromethanopterin S-methyltransferase subunit C [ANME-2 cluster archaeon]MBC2702025.1 tetrahydromethanopterin S-methyltransferase subunit C [ANME-2 cluster archaeon]MBC2706650.1 tetrahydromethanopterin S-methyltransferase subunit C [ANME-2 cluster archaeon]MBC2748735.1 tetrahydromethanopterin S-methyltransferase subunit C [ANME-2 cluster archaeon]MBC2762057.1 tetrahydromethanopterin S-methyltransferase subunit C [ANME-2 cluster archaeon]